MKKRYILLSMMTILCLSLGIFLVACKKSQPKIIFMDTDAVYATINTKGKEEITLPESPTKQDYIFEGWYFDKDVWQEELTKDTYKEKELSKEVKVYAKWEALFTIVYNLNGGTNGDNAVSYSKKDSTIVLEDASKLGYNFEGWYKEENFVTKVSEILPSAEENVTLYAKFSVINYEIHYHIPRGENWQGNPSTYNIESVITLADVISPKGYVFNGWYQSAQYQPIEKITGIQNRTGNVELYAKIDPIVYTITYYNLDGATHTNPSTYTIESETIVLADAVKEGGEFAGWYRTSDFRNQEETIPQGSTGNIYLYAKFNMNKYNVKMVVYQAKGVRQVFENEYEHGTQLSEIIPQKVSDETTCGWYLDEAFTKPYDMPQTLSSDIEAYTQEATLDKIRFDRGGIAISSNSVKGEVVVPKIFNGQLVTTLASNIVNSGAFESKYITRVILPGTITAIPSYCFAGCQQLSEVNLPNTIVSIGNIVFSDCRSLTTITIPKSVKSIGRISNAYLTTINYEGSQDEWNEISLDALNDFTNITINYDFTKKEN